MGSQTVQNLIYVNNMIRSNQTEEQSNKIDTKFRLYSKKYFWC